MVYSEVILEHFRNPRNYGRLTAPDLSHEDVNPLCGDRIRIELRIRDSIVEEARFKGDACAICIAGASILTELITGLGLDEVKGFSNNELLSALGGEINTTRLQCALLPVQVLRDAVNPAN